MEPRINFVVLRLDDWLEFFHNPKDISIHEFDERRKNPLELLDGDWTGKTYLNLAHRNLPVHASSQLCKNSINILHTDTLRMIWGKIEPDHFIVCIRGDKELPYTANFWLEQNGFCEPTAWRNSVPYWRQHDLIPRDAGRGTRIERIVFKGALVNINSAFLSAKFKAQLAGMGVEFSLGLDWCDSGDEAWRNYRGADLVLAARRMTPFEARTKPASKLVNAWAAGVPALLGPEPGFQELRRSDLDYIEVRSPEDVLAAIRRLRDNPELYAAMVKNGLERAEAFTDDAIAERWRALIKGPIAQAWECWKRRSKLRRCGGLLAGLFFHFAAWYFWRVQIRFSGRRMIPNVPIRPGLTVTPASSRVARGPN